MEKENETNKPLSVADIGKYYSYKVNEPPYLSACVGIWTGYRMTQMGEAIEKSLKQDKLYDIKLANIVDGKLVKE